MAFLLILAPLLLAQGQRDPTPKNQDVPRGEPGGTKESGKSSLRHSLMEKAYLLVYFCLCYVTLPGSAHSGCVREG